MKTRLIWFILFILWFMAIFVFTEQPVFNGEYSLRLFSLLGQTETTTYIIDFIARKLAHVVIFSLLAYLALKVMGDWHWKYSAAWVFTTLCGIANEWQQLLVPGRTSSLRDVAIDSAAALIIITIVYIVDKRSRL